MREVGVSVRSVTPAIERLRTLRLDVGSVLDSAGTSASLLADLDRRIPHEVALRIWAEAALLAGDPDFGIHAAESIRPGAFDVLDYAIRTSATIGDGLQRLVRYHQILHDAAVVSLDVENSYAVLTHTLPLDVAQLARQPAEFVVAAWLVVARQASGVDFVPVEVKLRHQAPPQTSEHHRVFRAPIRFESATNAIVISRDVLSLSLIRSDPDLCALLERRVRELVERMPKRSKLADRVRDILAAELSGGVPTAEALACRLHMSRRTFERRLNEEGTTYRDVVETLRRHFAERFLSEPQLAISEVAFLLGFSESSAFHRAFKRWTGTTPAAYRRAVVRPPVQ